MFEYQEWQGMLYGVFSLLLVIGMPVIINRMLNMTYPKAILTLLISCIIFMAIDRAIHSFLFNIAIEIDPLNELISMLVPICVIVISLIVDFITMSWQKSRKQYSA